MLVIRSFSDLPASLKRTIQQFSELLASAVLGEIDDKSYKTLEGYFKGESLYSSILSSHYAGVRSQLSAKTFLDQQRDTHVEKLALMMSINFQNHKILENQLNKLPDLFEKAKFLALKQEEFEKANRALAILVNNKISEESLKNKMEALKELAEFIRGLNEEMEKNGLRTWMRHQDQLMMVEIIYMEQCIQEYLSYFNQVENIIEDILHDPNITISKEDKAEIQAMHALIKSSNLEVRCQRLKVLRDTR